MRHRVGRSFVVLTAIVALYYLVPLRNRAEGDGALPFALLVMVGGFAMLWYSLRKRLAEYRAGGDWRAIGLEGLGVAIVVTAVLFAAVYFALATAYSAQMSGLETKTDALYYSVTTLATVGYGDIHPVGQVARGIATVQMLFDMMFVATATGLVVSALFARAQVIAARTATADEPGAAPPTGEE